MTRKLLIAALVAVSALSVGVLTFGRDASAQPSTHLSGLSGSVGASSRGPSSPDNITYPVQEGFEVGDFDISAFHSVVPTCVPGNCGWRTDTSPHSGSYAALAPEQNNVSDQQMVLSSPFAVPSNPVSATLSFWQNYSFETPDYDGGVLEFSTDTGGTWTDVLSNTNFISGGYTGSINGAFHNPLANRQGWIGSSGGYTQVTVNLLPFAGQSLLFRLRMGTDDCCIGIATGWRVDDFLVTLATSAPCPPTTPSWNLQAPYPIAIADQAVVAHRGKVYSFGGYSGINSTNPVTNSYVYDPYTDIWAAIADLPAARGGNRAVSNGVYIYIMGGIGGGGYTNTLWRYDPIADTYATLATSTFTAADHAAVYLNGYIFKIAGGPYNFEWYTISSNSWTYNGQYYYPESVVGLSAITYQSYIYAAGGNDTSGVYRSSGGPWSSFGSLPGNRYGAASGILNGRWILAGGWVSGAPSDTVLVSNVGVNNWTRLTSMPQARSYVGGATVDQAFYAIGGYDPSGNPSTTNQQYLEQNCIPFTPVPTSTPTSALTDTPTSTFTPTITSTPTNTPTPLLIGHITWQGRSTQPSPLQVMPLTLTLKSGAVEVNYPPYLVTDADGFFTVSLGTLPTGIYGWRVKGPSYLATAGSFTLVAGVNNVEMGLQLTGDLNGDNLCTVSDFNLLKPNIGRGGAPPLGPGGP